MINSAQNETHSRNPMKAVFMQQTSLVCLDVKPQMREFKVAYLTW